MQTAAAKPPKVPFTPYQLMILAIIAFIQFTVVLDFMVMAPLGAILMPELDITPRQFSIAVAAYPISAFLSGFTASFFADRFDRKKFLVFFYTGFVIGTFLCGVAPGYLSLVAARIFTGIFGGVIASISMAIITDLFAPEQRGRVMGVVQMAFGVSQVVGIPLGLFLANIWDWHMPFLLIVAVAVVVGILVVWRMKPVNAHLALQRSNDPLQKILDTFGNPLYLKAYATTALLPLGGYMLMPFSTAFLRSNVGVAESQLPMVFFITGLFSLGVGPLIGFVSDKVGKFKVFLAGTALSICMVFVYTNMGVLGIPLVITINVILFVGVTGRIIPASAINSMVPNPADRGAFMSVNSSLAQLSGGIGSFLAGLIVVQVNTTAPLLHFEWVGYITAVSMVATVLLMNTVRKGILSRDERSATPPSI